MIRAADSARAQHAKLLLYLPHQHSVVLLHILLYLVAWARHGGRACNEEARRRPYPCMPTLTYEPCLDVRGGHEVGIEKLMLVRIVLLPVRPLNKDFLKHSCRSLDVHLRTVTQNVRLPNEHRQLQLQKSTSRWPDRGSPDWCCRATFLNIPARILQCTCNVCSSLSQRPEYFCMEVTQQLSIVLTAIRQYDAPAS